MAIASKALHQSKQNWGSGCYNIKPSILLLSSSAYFKSCAVHVTRNVFVECFIEDLSFFFEIKQRLKSKTYNIDKEETSIMILKSFSYKVISKY